MLCVGLVPLRAVDVGEIELAAREALGGEADAVTERAALKEIPQPHMEQPHVAPKVQALHPKLRPELGAVQKPMETAGAFEGRWEYVEDEEAGESAGGTVANIDEYNTLAAKNTKLKIAARKAEDALAQAKQAEQDARETLDEAKKARDEASKNGTDEEYANAKRELANAETANVQAKQALMKAQMEEAEIKQAITENAQARANLQKKLIEEQEAAAARGEKLTPKPERLTEPREKVARPIELGTAKTLAREFTPEEIALEAKRVSFTEAQNKLTQAELEEKNAVELFSNSQVFQQGSPEWKEARDIYLAKNKAVMDAQSELHKATVELEQAQSLAEIRAAEKETQDAAEKAAAKKADQEAAEKAKQIKTAARISPEQMAIETKQASFTEAQKKLTQAQVDEGIAFRKLNRLQQGTQAWEEANDVYHAKERAVTDAQSELHKATIELQEASSAAKMSTAEKETKDALATETAAKKKLADAQKRFKKVNPESPEKAAAEDEVKRAQKTATSAQTTRLKKTAIAAQHKIDSLNAKIKITLDEKLAAPHFGPEKARLAKQLKAFEKQLNTAQQEFHNANQAVMDALKKSNAAK